MKQHKSAFSRQIMEAVLVYRGGKNVLNSKSEFSRCSVPRLEVSYGGRQIDAVPVSTTEEEELKRKSVDLNWNQSLPAKRRRRRGQYEQSEGPIVSVSGSASPGVSGGAETHHGHGGGQPQQHRGQHGHSLGQDDGGDVRAVPKTFKDLVPHNHRPKPTIIETRATSKGNINYYFKTSNGAALSSKPNHPT